MLRYAVIVTLGIATPMITPCLAADPATKQATSPVAPTATFVAQAAFGNMFDVYIEAQYKAHVETVELFKGYAQGGEDTRMRAFAAELLPKLQAHLDHVAKMR